MGEKSNATNSSCTAQQQPNVTPSPPMNEQSPSTQQQNNTSNNTNSRPTSSVLISGMRTAQSLAEWQLQAVLYRAKLTQYFDTFISQGGDDIDQIMQCDEEEFLEIMSLVGMASKPLHVRRLQRTLSEFSLNRAQFLISAVPFIGLPPIDFPSTSSSDNLTAALQFLVPGYLPSASADQLCHSQPMTTSATPSDIFFAAATSSMLTMPSSTQVITQQNMFGNSAGQRSTGPSTSPSATAIALPLPDPSSFLLSLVNPSHFTPNVHQQQQQHTQPFSPYQLQQQFQTQQLPRDDSDGPSKRIKLSSFSPPPTTPTTSAAQGMGMASANSRRAKEMAGRGDEAGTAVAEASAGSFSTGTSSSSPNDRLTDAEISRLRQFAQEMVEQLPIQLEPRQGQNRRRMERGLLEAMSLPPDNPLRLEHFRLFARIYGRFDAKRKPNKALTRHERIVNEAAAQLSLLRPELLSRRDELFPLARKLARLFELPLNLRTSSAVEAKGSASPPGSSMIPNSVRNSSPTSNEECCDGTSPSTFVPTKHEKGDEFYQGGDEEEDEESQESEER
ncbi:hypothetical protein niasHT_021375 [Heterodera trifolii]|uniref:Uncharacterized protein n=1 Tax=Heterodera trifolii TaxID=157864 RepID=A0ABD2K6K6_9BILA